MKYFVAIEMPDEAQAEALHHALACRTPEVLNLLLNATALDVLPAGPEPETGTLASLAHSPTHTPNPEPIGYEKETEAVLSALTDLCQAHEVNSLPELPWHAIETLQSELIRRRRIYEAERRDRAAGLLEDNPMPDKDLANAARLLLSVIDDVDNASEMHYGGITHEAFRAITDAAAVLEQVLKGAPK